MLYSKIANFFGNDLDKLKIGIWGLSFKPNTDDIREAPSIELISSLLGSGVIVKVFDPEAMEHMFEKFGNQVEFMNSKYDAIENVDALCIMTEWSEFRNPDFELMGSNMKSKVIFDGRNVLTSKE